MANKTLTDLFQRSQREFDQANFDTADLEALSEGLSDVAQRRVAFITLGLIFNRDSSTSETGTAGFSRLQDQFFNFIASRISGTIQYDGAQEYIHTIHLLDALFHVNGRLASAIFTTPDIFKSIMNNCVIYSEQMAVLTATASLLSQACTIGTSRETVASSCTSWLQGMSKINGANPELAAHAGCALLKLSVSSSAAKLPEGLYDINLVVSSMRQLVIGVTDIDVQTIAIEGLAHASSKSIVKELLSRDATFLSAAFGLVPERPTGTSTPLHYGLLLIATNIVSLQPSLSAEEIEIRKLRKLSSQGHPGIKPEDTDDSLEDKLHIRERICRLLDADCIALISRIARLKCSNALCKAAGAVFLNVVEFTDLRGRVLQAGGSKTLLKLISLLGTDASTDDRLTLSQALAKLTITAPPLAVFGPDQERAIEAIRPFVTLVVEPQSSLLQRFEGLMALTNLVTINMDLAERVAVTNGFLPQLETHFLEQNPLVRRASVELLCNLVASSETAFVRFTGTSPTPNAAVKSRLHILVAMCDVEDLPTRMAASAVMAILCTSSAVATGIVALELEQHRVLPILLSLLATPSGWDGAESATEKCLTAHPGIFLRGVTCFNNVFKQYKDEPAWRSFLNEAKRQGLPVLVASGFDRLHKSNLEISGPSRSLIDTLKGLGS